MPFHIGCGIILNQQDKYVLVHETRSFKRGFYNIPGGTLEIDEDFLQTVQREAKEETGADITLEHFVGVYQTVMANSNNVVFLIFAGSVADDAVFHSDEHDVIKAYSYDELVALDKADKLRSPNILQSIDDYRAGQRLPLQAVQAWHVDRLDTITVEKEH